MSKIQLDEKTCSFSDFQSDVASYLDNVKNKDEILLITQDNETSAVVIDAEEYKKLVEKAQLLEEIVAARKELKSGEGVDHDEFINTLRSQYSP